jgi:hypothetical protein
MSAVFIEMCALRIALGQQGTHRDVTVKDMRAQEQEESFISR